MEVLSTNPSMQNLIDKINELVGSVNGTLVTNSEEMAAIKKLVSFGSDVLAAKLNSKLWYFKTQELMVASGELVEGDSCFILGANAETGKGTFSYWYIYKTDDVKDIIDSYVALNNPDLVAVKLSNLESIDEIRNLIAEHNVDSKAHSDIRLIINDFKTAVYRILDSDDVTLDQVSEIVAYIKSNKELIDAITTSKISVSDIIDNLTTSVSNKPLSAKQGVALKALIDSIPTWAKESTPDSTLTQSGKAADAKVVGDNLRYLKTYVTPQMFGALADGTTDDTNAINQAIENLAVGGMLFFPKGTYIHTGITLNKPCDIVGESYRSVNLKNVGDGDSLTITHDAGGTKIKNITISSNGTDNFAAGATGKKGIVIQGSSYITLEHVNVCQHSEDLLYAYNSGHTNNIYVNNCIFGNGGGDGITFVQSDFSNQINAINIHQCDIKWLNGNGINLWGNAINVDSCTIQMCKGYGISVNGSDEKRIGDGYVYGLAITKNYFELCYKAFIYLYACSTPVVSYINGVVIDANYGTYGVRSEDSIPDNASCVKIVSFCYGDNLHMIGGMLYKGNGFVSLTDGVPILDAGGNLNSQNFIFPSWCGNPKENKFVNLGDATVFYGQKYITEEELNLWKTKILEEVEQMIYPPVNLLDITMRTYTTYSEPSFIENTETREIDYTKCYAIDYQGRRGQYPSDKFTNFIPTENGYSVNCSSTSGYGIEFPIEVESGKTYKLTWGVTDGNTRKVNLIKFNSDTTVNSLTNLTASSDWEATFTAEEGYLYAISFHTASETTEFINISLIEV